jgi:PST family polysaccharide transporter
LPGPNPQGTDETQPRPAEPEPGHDEGRVEPHGLRRLARLGALALSARTFVVQFIVLGGQVVLARRLDPQHFGVYAIVQFALTFLGFFGDAGLGGALVQKKSAPSDLELSSVFYLQLMIGVGVVALAFAGAPVILWIWPDLPPDAPWVLRALACNFFVTSLRALPGLLMERQMMFVRIAILDTINSVVFYLVAVVLALSDFGIWSLVGGVLVQGLVALIVAFVMRPYRPRAGFDRAVLKPLLRFGVPLQLHVLLGMALGALTPLFGGRALGAHAVGLINWAQNTSHFPLQLIHIISRISFPLYSRLQDQREELRRAIERSLRVCAIGTMLFVAVVLATGPRLVSIVYSDKWLEAMPLLYIYTGTITIGFFAPVAATALEAIGKPGVVLRLSVVVTGLIWLAVPPAALWWGVQGFAAAYVLMMVLGNVAMLIIVRRFFPEVELLPQVVPATLAALATAPLGRYALMPWITGPGTLTAAIVLIVLAFAVLVLLLDRRLWREEVLPLWRKLRHPRVSAVASG